MSVNFVEFDDSSAGGGDHIGGLKAKLQATTQRNYHLNRNNSSILSTTLKPLSLSGHEDNNSKDRVFVYTPKSSAIHEGGVSGSGGLNSSLSSRLPP